MSQQAPGAFILTTDDPTPRSELLKERGGGVAKLTAFATPVGAFLAAAFSVTFVFAPGVGGAQGNTYDDWDELQEAFDLVAGPKTIAFDPTHAPIVIPPGAWSLDDCAAVSNTGALVTVTWSKGATYTSTNLKLDSVVFSAEQMISETLTAGALLVLDHRANIQGKPGQPSAPLLVNTGGSLQVFVQNEASLGDVTGTTALRVAGAGVCRIYEGQTWTMFANAVVADPTATLAIQNDGEVFVRPIDGVRDDWPRLMGTIAPICAANGYELVLEPGLAGEAWIVKTVIFMPSGLRLRGTSATRVVQTLPVFASNNGAFVAGIVQFGATSAFAAANVLGTDTVSSTTSYPVGTVLYLNNVIGNRGNVYTVTAVAGVGPFTLTVDRPVLYQFVIGDNMNRVTSQPHDIDLDGRGMVVTGSGSVYLNIIGGVRCSFRNITLDDSGGALTDPASIAAIFDTGGNDVSMANLVVKNTGSECLRLASVERGVLTDCRAQGATADGVSLSDCVECDLVRVYSFLNAANGLSFNSDGSNKGCQNCRATSCLFIENTQNGITPSSLCTGLVFTDCDARKNGANGLFLDASAGGVTRTQVKGGNYTENAVDGILQAIGCKDLSVSDVNLENNANVGLYFKDDGQASNVTIAGHTPTGSFGIRVDGGIVNISNFQFKGPAQGVNCFFMTGGRVTLRGAALTADDGVGFPAFVQNSGGVLYIEGIETAGAHIATNCLGLVMPSAGATTRIGYDCNFDACAVPFNFAAGIFVSKSNVPGNPVAPGPITLTGVVPVAVPWPDLKSDDLVTVQLIDPNGGTPSPVRIVQTPGTGFTLAGSIVADTSKVEYLIA